MAAPPPSLPRGQPELIVILKDQPRVETVTHARVSSSLPTSSAAPSTTTSSLQDILQQHGASMKPLFGPTEERVRHEQVHQAVMSRMASSAAEGSTAHPAEEFPDLTKFHKVDAPNDKLDQIARELRDHHQVEAAYVKPAGSLPIVAIPIPASTPAPSITPNFLPLQNYFNAAPGGIDANYSQSVPGGFGDGVKVIDCEWGWTFTHEDLKTNKGGIIAGTNYVDSDKEREKRFIDHGTAVAGIISGDNNNYGVTGIAPNAVFSASSFSQGYATCVTEAAKKLDAGDILLLEIHQAGPGRPQNTSSESQFGLIAFEWWPDQFAAIQAAVKRGVIVVQAAGNGEQNLDDPVYNTNSSFPSTWKNPFDLKNPQSGAIMVGAGNPPPGTHGITQDKYGPDRSKCWFSNYGSRVDVQGWGQEVTTTGYGDLQAGNGSRDIEYTNQFGGTSSASPIVVGALAAIQGILKKANRPVMTPAQALSLLRATGSPQQDHPQYPLSMRIGNRPDLRKMIPLALAGKWKG